MHSYNIRPLFDKTSSTWTYILYDKDTLKAVILDPVLEHRDRDLTCISQMGLTLDAVIETHIHADHITAASQLREATGARLVYGAANSEVDVADVFLSDGDVLPVGNSNITTITTPGHTAGCTSFMVEGTVFTGDALFIRGCGRTDFQGGSPETLFDSVRDKLFTLPDDTLIHPAHDYKGQIVSTIGEEKKFNPRLQLTKSKQDFVGIMNGLNLPYPAKMDVAVPANLKAGDVAA